MSIRRVGFAVLALALTSVPAHALPSYDEVRTAHRPSDTLLLDRNGEVLHRLRTDATVRRGQWVALADISPACAPPWSCRKTSASTSTAASTGAPCP